MPILGNRKFDHFISPIQTQVRNDSIKGQWKYGKDLTFGEELDMVILGYETRVGCVPPISSYAQLESLLRENKKEVPPVDDIAGIVTAVQDQAQVWGILWFVPIVKPGSKLAKLIAEGKVPTDKSVWTTLIKSRSLDGTKTQGFWTHLDNVNKSGKDLADVISTTSFQATHKRAGGSGDVLGLVWSTRNPESPEEEEFLKKVREWLDDVASNEIASSQVFRLPDICSKQFEVIPNDAVRGMALPAVRQVSRQAVINGLLGSSVGDDDTLIELMALPAAIDVQSTTVPAIAAAPVPPAVVPSVAVPPATVDVDVVAEPVTNGKGKGK